MIAYLNIHPDNFVYNGSDSEADVASKIFSLVSDMRDICYNNTKENIFQCHEDIFSCLVYQNTNIIDFAANHLNFDEQVVFFSIFGNTSNSFKCSLDELRDKCRYDVDEKEVNSMLLLNSLSIDDPVSPSQFDKYEVIFNHQSWVTLRRQILGNHPGSSEKFIDECRLYFPNLHFHDNCVSSLEEDNYLECIPRKIIYYLSALNDTFFYIRGRHLENGNDANSILADFSGTCCLDKAGSLQGNPSTKHRRKFTFNYSDSHISRQELIECEPHLKIELADNNYQGILHQPFHPRIYFHFGKENVEGGKILIGSIGPHL